MSDSYCGSCGANLRLEWCDCEEPEILRDFEDVKEEKRCNND